MAKYFESSTDFSSRTLNSPVDLLRFVVAGIFLSPVRLIFEVSRKCLFLGEYFNKFILNAIYVNVGLIVLSIANSFMITKRFYIKGGFLPISSLVISVLCLCVIYYFGSRYSLEVDFELKDSIDDVVNKLEDVYGVESPVTQVTENEESEKDETVSLIDRINLSSESSSLDDDEELEITTEDDFDNIYDNEVNKAMEKVPKENVSALQSRLDNLKSQVKEKTLIHNKDVSLLNSLKSTMDDIENKTNTIKERYVDIDDGLEERVRLVDLVRKGKTLGEEISEKGDSFDDDPQMVEDINSYSKSVTERATRKRQSLDSLMSSSNSSSMVDINEGDINPSITNDFLDNLNSSSSIDLVDDGYDPNGIDFMTMGSDNDPFSIYGTGGLGYDNVGLGVDLGNI